MKKNSHKKLGISKVSMVLIISVILPLTFIILNNPYLSNERDMLNDNNDNTELKQGDIDVTFSNNNSSESEVKIKKFENFNLAIFLGLKEEFLLLKEINGMKYLESQDGKEIHLILNNSKYNYIRLISSSDINEDLIVSNLNNYDYSEKLFDLMYNEYVLKGLTEFEILTDIGGYSLNSVLKNHMESSYTLIYQSPDAQGSALYIEFNDENLSEISDFTIVSKDVGKSKLNSGIIYYYFEGEELIDDIQLKSLIKSEFQN